MEIDEILDGAADVLEFRGHTKGLKHNRRENTYCAVGALEVSAKLDESELLWPWLNVEFNKTLSFLGRFIDPKYDRKNHIADAMCHIARWNDDPSTTKQEVVSTLRLAAKTYREENQES